MKRTFRGAVAIILPWLLFIVPPSAVSAQSPPGSDPAKGLAQVCAQAAETFLARFNKDLETALARGPATGLEFFGNHLSDLEKGFSNQRITLRLLGGRKEDRKKGLDVFDQTTLMGFVRAGRRSPGTVSFFLNPEGKDREFRFYREVRADISCLACHGPRDAVDSRLREMIGKRFPDYDGFGFREGEVMGVVGIRVEGPTIR